MELWKENEVFKGLISVTSESLGMPAFVVEKDFYVMEILKQIAKKRPEIVFKGGTSLSKAYGAIKRFSEDLDLSVILPAGFKETGEPRAQYEPLLLSPVMETLKEMGFAKEPEYQPNSSPKYYCVYQSLDRALFSGGGAVDSKVKIESTLLSKPFPTERKTIESYIFSYLKKNQRNDLIAKYGLGSFEVSVQSIARTAIDKMCAICDYYLQKKARRNSRHIYDIYQISKMVDYSSQDFRNLAKLVYNERKTMDRAYSANEGVSMTALFRAIINNGFYAQDYKEVTNAIVFSGGEVPYEKALSALEKIIELGIFC